MVDSTLWHFMCFINPIALLAVSRPTTPVAHTQFIKAHYFVVVSCLPKYLLPSPFNVQKWVTLNVGMKLIMSNRSFSFKFILVKAFLEIQTRTKKLEQWSQKLIFEHFQSDFCFRLTSLSDTTKFQLFESFVAQHEMKFPIERIFEKAVAMKPQISINHFNNSYRVNLSNGTENAFQC